MTEFTAFVTNITNIAIWLLIGPLFAVILFHLAERRWGTGPTWAFLGFCFNIFALLAYLLLAGYESNSHYSSGILESQRVTKLLHATRDFDSQKQRAGTAVQDEQPALSTDPYIDELLASHRQAEALDYARERLRVAFQTGDSGRETLYGRYVSDIAERDAQLQSQLESLKRESGSSSHGEMR
jgi:hypothetical protein